MKRTEIEKMIIELNLWLQSVASAPKERNRDVEKKKKIRGTICTREGAQAEENSISRQCGMAVKNPGPGIQKI